MKKLFLDDILKPYDIFIKTIDPDYEDNKTWDIVKTYDDFVKYIEQNGLPDLISFDHDLDIDHYKAENQHYINYDKMKVKSGLHAAMWLKKYCKENNVQMPKCKVHSMNKEGRKNILSVLY